MAGQPIANSLDDAERAIQDARRILAQAKLHIKYAIKHAEKHDTQEQVTRLDKALTLLDEVG